MRIQKAYFNDKYEASVVCSNCLKKQAINALQFKKHANRIIAKCSCGSIFLVSLRRAGGIPTRMASALGS